MASMSRLQSLDNPELGELRACKKASKEALSGQNSALFG
jgi:hypothetical protein